MYDVQCTMYDVVSIYVLYTTYVYVHVYLYTCVCVYVYCVQKCVHNRDKNTIEPVNFIIKRFC